MKDEIYEKYILAGKIAANARDFGIGLIKCNMSYLELVLSIELKILEKGGGLAFPVNISVNEIAAHFSPKDNDNLVFKKGDVVKLDIGVHIDGYIADTAITIEVETNKYDKMIKASSDALDGAINLMKPGLILVQIGEVVEDTIKSYGYKPIDNLTGHSLERYVIHAGLSVPSVPSIIKNTRLKVDNVLAIEPFATNGAGHVTSGDGSNIYLCRNSINPRFFRDKNIKTISSKMKNKFRTLPFAQRWFKQLFPNNDSSLRKLAFLGIIKHYPQLVESKKGIVTQKEHTVIITEEGCEVIT